MTFGKFPRNLSGDTWNSQNTPQKHTETAYICDAQACGSHTVTTKGQVREDSSVLTVRGGKKDFVTLVTLWEPWNDEVGANDCPCKFMQSERIQVQREDNKSHPQTHFPSWV